jgi:hypothetical protein
MKRLFKFFCLILILLCMSNKIFTQDFTVKSPSTDKYNGLITPLKAGSSIQLQIKMKNNKTVTYTVSINKNSLYL